MYGYDFQMLRQEENPGIEFEYSIPSGSVQETPQGGEGYIWSPGPWSDCPSECGGDKKTRKILCTLSSTKEVVDDNLCDSTNKPLDEEACNDEPCEVGIVYIIYGITGCGVFKRGIQNWQDVCLRINIPKGNY